MRSIAFFCRGKFIRIFQEQEEGVHQMSGESCGRPGESEQDAHRRTQIAEGALLPQVGVKSWKNVEVLCLCAHC